jgi:hypothetical protein
MINNNYMEWIINHMNIVKNDNGKIHIVATIHKVHEETFRKNVFELYPNVSIDCYYENEYEYRGIMKVWELGKIYKENNDIILYFHSKGITYTEHFSQVRNWGQNDVISDFNKIKEIFDIFPTIDKIGNQTSTRGSMFINFWYARGSYINQVDIPIKTKDRFYYEGWLEQRLTPKEHNEKSYLYSRDNCYQFYTDKSNFANIGSYFDPNIQSYLNN